VIITPTNYTETRLLINIRPTDSFQKKQKYEKKVKRKKIEYIIILNHLKNVLRTRDDDGRERTAPDSMIYRIPNSNVINYLLSPSSPTFGDILCVSSLVQFTEGELFRVHSHT